MTKPRSCCILALIGCVASRKLSDRHQLSFGIDLIILMFSPLALSPNSPSVSRHGMQNEASGAAGGLGSFGRRQVGVPSVSVKAIAVDLVGVARDDIEQRRHHFVRLDEARGA